MALPPGKLFCFGMGYSASGLAAALRPRGWTVIGARRTAAPGDMPVHIFDGVRPLAGFDGVFRGVTHILSSVPPDENGDPVLRLHAAQIAALPDLRWVGYLSTTGVYGDRKGGWVTEDSACLPTTRRGARRLAAENDWLKLWRAYGLPVHVFRLAGIYGPGRNVLAGARQGTARRICKPGQVFSRVHRDDIVGALTASLNRPRPGAVYNVCDDEPCAPAAVTAYACALLGVASPAVESFPAPGMSAMAESFYADNKRVANRRLKEELGVTLRWPNYRVGLRGLAAAGE